MSLRSFSSVSLVVFEFLRCIPAGNTEVVLLKPAMDCHSSEYRHRLPIVYSILVLWICAVPIGMFVFLRAMRSRKLLHQSHILRRWGFLYATYGPRFWWFEVFVMGRRVLISALAVLLLQYPNSRSAALTIALIVFLVVQMSLSPYAHRVPNLCDVIGLTSLLLLSAMGSGHSILHDAEYPVVVQVLSALVIAIVGLGLLIHILLGRLRQVKIVAAFSERISSKLQQCWCCATNDAVDSADSNWTLADSSANPDYPISTADLAVFSSNHAMDEPDLDDGGHGPGSDVMDGAGAPRAGSVHRGSLLERATLDTPLLQSPEA